MSNTSKNNYQIKFTEAGMNAAFNAQNQGFKLQIAHIALGASDYQPTGQEIALVDERQREPVQDFEQFTVDGQTTYYMAARFDGASQYPIREVGLFLSDGTLLGIASQPGKFIGYKTTGDVHIQQVAIPIGLLPADSIDVQVTEQMLNLVNLLELASIGTAIAELQLSQLRISDELNINLAV